MTRCSNGTGQIGLGDLEGLFQPRWVYEFMILQPQTSGEQTWASSWLWLEEFLGKLQWKEVESRIARWFSRTSPSKKSPPLLVVLSEKRQCTQSEIQENPPECKKNIFLIGRVATHQHTLSREVTVPQSLRYSKPEYTALSNLLQLTLLWAGGPTRCPPKNRPFPSQPGELDTNISTNTQVIVPTDLW